MCPSSKYFSYFHKMVFLFSSPPFYMAHVKMSAQDDIQLEIQTIQGFGRTSKMWLLHVMKATFMLHYPQKIGEHSEITKALSPKIASLHAALTFNLLTPSLGGRTLQLMHVSTRTLVKKTYTSRKANIFWPTLDIHIAPGFSYLIRTLAIILQSGGVQHWGMYY